MRYLVVYKSATGFTEKYANWIGENLNCPVKSLKEVTEQDIANADCIIYGGSIVANMIGGLSKFRKMNDGKLVVFAVGAAPSETAEKQVIIRENKLDTDSFFYLRGGINYEKLAFAQKTMLKMFFSSLSKKTDRTPEEQGTMEALMQSFDATDKTAIAPLINYCQQINS